MIAFLIKRKIAVIMSFVACIGLGLISLNEIPVSLLPHIDIPRIEIKFEQPNLESEQLKNTVIKPGIRELGLINNIKDIYAETKNGESTIYIELIEGTDVNIAYLEITERIEKLLSRVPRNIQRPKILKFSPSEIPVFFINSPYPYTKDSQNMTYTNFIKSICKKRLESLEGVSYVDVTGYLSKRVVIEVEDSKLKSYNISYASIKDLIRNNNIIGKNLEVRDKSYIYKVHLNESLSNIEQIKNLPINLEENYIKLKDIANVQEEISADNGWFVQDGIQGISMAVIKNEKSKIKNLKEDLHNTLSDIQHEYPEFSFQISQDQTGILESSIRNLFESLLLGLLLAGVLVYLFIKNLKLSLIISIVIPSSVVISFLFIKILGISINIISLSGLIIGVGLMIDNSIIMIDNISQYREEGCTLIKSCVKGTNDVIKPLLTSLLTTCIIFIPLIFIEGIAGVLFYDQAIALIIGLSVSYLITIIVLPTFYKIANITKANYVQGTLYVLYHNIFNFLFTKKSLVFFSITLFTIASFLLINFLKIEKFPNLSYNELDVEVDWGQNLSKDQLVASSNHLYSELTNIDNLKSINYYIESQDFSSSLSHQFEKGKTKYIIESTANKAISITENEIATLLREKYSNLDYTIKPVENLFDKVFKSRLSNLFIKVYERKKVVPIVDTIKKQFSEIKVLSPVKEQVYQLTIHHTKLINYGLTKESLFNQLSFLFGKTKIDNLKNEGNTFPVYLKQQHNNLYDILNRTSIYTENKGKIPLSSLVSIFKTDQDKLLYTDMQGDYIPLNIQSTKEDIVIKYYNKKLSDQTNSIDGKYFEDRKFINDFTYIIIIELILLYFILSIQFNSLLLPLIILIELPISMAGSILALFIFGYSLNVMSGIGIIVSLGIVINDSIIKIDTMNKIKRNPSIDILDVVRISGEKRLNAIVMTSLTTMLATIPLLFNTDLGSSIQKPLAISLIGSLFIGTLVSLFLIPLLYWKINSLSLSKQDNVLITKRKK